MDELITKQQAIDALEKARAYIGHNMERAVGAAFIEILDDVGKDIGRLPSAQFATDTNVGTKLGTNLAEVGTDVHDINKFIDSLEEIFADIRERHVDDSVCGLCEYDGAYIGQSGDWCNECPGFDRDDCFKLSDKCRKRWIDTITKALPSAQPERKKGKWIPVTRIEEWSKEEGLTGFPPEVAEFPNCTIKYVDATEPDEVDAVKCSECGTVFDFTDARNWCSECGADMRGEQDE